MSNGDTATLPSMGTPPFVPTEQDRQTRMQQFMSLLKRLGPNVLTQGQQAPGQTQGPTQTPAIVPPLLLPPGAKYDPTSTVGSLPAPVPQPERQGYQEPPFGAQLMQQLDPRAAATFTGIQGVSQFLQTTFQKKDQEKHAEAANAAQALMSALESAKTTGDYRPAQHILENNEQLFNKVYKGWLQKAEEAKKPKKQEKVDPEVTGFEQALASYYQSQQPKGQQQQQPQAPTTLMGRSGSKYMIPQETLEQQMATQQVQAGIAKTLQEAKTSQAEETLRQTQAERERAGIKVDQTKAEAELELRKKESETAKKQLEEAESKIKLAESPEQKQILQARANLLKAQKGEADARAQYWRSGGRLPQQQMMTQLKAAQTDLLTMYRSADSEIRKQEGEIRKQSGLQKDLADIGITADPSIGLFGSKQNLVKLRDGLKWLTGEGTQAVTSGKMSVSQAVNEAYKRAGIDAATIPPEPEAPQGQMPQPIVVSPDDMKD